MKVFFNKSVKINNPLRIFFLCGSHYNKNTIKVKINGNEFEIEDKRKVLLRFIEQQYLNKNFRSIILEDNFMFSNRSRRHLNYNDINLKSLKSIELLTSLYSDYVFIVHESFSTAAEIGMFSASDYINSKLMILTPNVESIEEDYISGFMKLAYQNKFYTAHNINTIYYNPGIYNFYVSDYVRKLHTFFVNNKVNGSLAKKISQYLDALDKKDILFGKKHGIHNNLINYYQIIDSRNINIIINSNDLLAYLISLFNVDDFRKEFIVKVDMSHLKHDKENNRRKSLFKERTELIEKYFKHAIYYTIKTDIPNFENEYGDINLIDSFMNIRIKHQVVELKECISYYLYILYALEYIGIKDDNTRFSISNSFTSVYDEYKTLIQEVSNKKKIWSRK
jgi:hypothetical protein